MPSQRRLKTFGLLVFIAVLITLYITASARQTRSSEFYTKTQKALEEARSHKEAALGGSGGSGGDDVGSRLREAEEAAKRSADRKGEEFHGEEGKARAKEVREKGEKDEQEKAKEEVNRNDGGRGGSSGAGAARKVRTGGNEAVLKGEKKDEKDDEKEPETEEDKNVRAELNDILKRSPVIIFSKSYCPFSKKAKHILLESYNISPPPYVVELDLHPLGAPLQAKLADMTGRRTVPNILINGRSIGGGDDVQNLDESGELIEKVKSMGGKRMVVTKNKETEDEGEKEKRQVFGGAEITEGRRRRKIPHAIVS